MGGNMRALPLILSLVCCGCTQFSQQAAGPIPPPAPETLCRPIPEALQHYYTLPAPEKN